MDSTHTGYEATQMQRKVERSIRKQKNRILVDEATGDAEKLRTDQIRLRRLNEEYKRFSSAACLRTEPERAVVAGFWAGTGKKGQRLVRSSITKNGRKKLAQMNPSNLLQKYYDVKYTDSPRYALLQGYARAVEKHDISPACRI